MYENFEYAEICGGANEFIHTDLMMKPNVFIQRTKFSNRAIILADNNNSSNNNINTMSRPIEDLHKQILICDPIIDTANLVSPSSNTNFISLHIELNQVISACMIFSLLISSMFYYSLPEQKKFETLFNNGDGYKVGGNCESSVHDKDAHSILKELRGRNVNRIIIAHLNINSIRNKFDVLAELITTRSYRVWGRPPFIHKR